MHINLELGLGLYQQAVDLSDITDINHSNDMWDLVQSNPKTIL